MRYMDKLEETDIADELEAKVIDSNYSQLNRVNKQVVAINNELTSYSQIRICLEITSGRSWTN